MYLPNNISVKLLKKICGWKKLNASEVIQKILAKRALLRNNP